MRSFSFTHMLLPERCGTVRAGEQGMQRDAVVMIYDGSDLAREGRADAAADGIETL